jgi:uncharacterized RDD family membrane protein YckC
MISAAMAVAAAFNGVDRAAFAREARSGRLAAVMVDTIVLALLTGLVNAVYGVTQVTSAYVAGSESVTTTTTAVAWPWLMLLGVVYFAVGEAMFGTTLGKRWMHLKVVRADGTPLTVRDVLVRNVLKPVDFLPIFYLLGGAFVILTPGAQRLGDLAAGTTVVYGHRAGATLTSGPTARRVLVAALALAAVVTVLFAYFGRPALVIDGLYKTGHLPGLQLSSYTLGAARWGFGTVTYDFAGTRPSQRCSGTVTLSWQVLGWTESAGQMACVPS